MAARVSLDDKYGLDRGCVFISGQSQSPTATALPATTEGNTSAVPSQPQLAYIALSFASAARISVSWCLGSLLFLVSFGHIHINVTLTVLRVGVKLTKKIKEPSLRNDPRPTLVFPRHQRPD